MNEIDKLHAAGLQQDLDNAALDARRLRVENEELKERLWAAEKALSDTVANLQRLRDKLNAERVKLAAEQSPVGLAEHKERHGGLRSQWHWD